MLYGREPERGTIGTLLRDAGASRGGALVVSGRPGVGKTALLEDAARRTDARVLRAQGIESESQLAFAGLHQLLRPLVDDVDRLPEAQADALRCALGMRRSDTSPDRFLVSVATLGVLCAAADERPVVGLVDDAHWLDTATTSALTFVARRLALERVALIFAVREGEADAVDFGGLPVLRVAGLDAAAAAALLSDRAGLPVNPDVAARLVDETAGNALALAELPAMLTPEHLRGDLPLPSPLRLPGDVEAAFLGRVRRLPDAAQVLLLVAATDTTQRVAVLVRAAELLGVPAERLDAAERAGLVSTRDGRVSFRHPLVRSAVYHAATDRERRQAHLALASVLDGDDEIERRAWHRATAALGPDEGAAADLDAAARRANARGAYEVACAALERAAEVTEDSEPRARRLAAAAHQAWRGGQLRRAEALLHRAGGLTLVPELRAEIGRLRAWIEMTVGSPVAAVELLRDASRRIALIDPDTALEMISEAAEAAWVVGDHAVARRLTGPPAERISIDGSRTRFFVHLINGLRGLLDDDLGSAVEALRSAVDIARSSDDAGLVSRAAHVAFYVGDDAAARELNARLVARARTAGAVGELLPALERLAHAEVVTSRWPAAVANASEASRLAVETGQPQLAALPAAWLALIAALTGDRDRFQQAITDSQRLAGARPLGAYEPMVHGVVCWSHGVQLAADGQSASALGWFEEISHPVVARMAALDRIETALHADQRQLARTWLASFEPFADHTGSAWANARVAHCQALLSDAADAGQQFEEALAHHQHADRGFERARTELAYGRFLRRIRHRVQARGHLRAALHVFDGLGAIPWSERTRQELRASGESARKRDPSTLRDLTPQELQVARLVAEGLTTKDVAARLFLSPRTIEFHLHNVFAKLQISSRTELAHIPLE